MKSKYLTFTEGLVCYQLKKAIDAANEQLANQGVKIEYPLTIKFSDGNIMQHMPFYEVDSGSVQPTP